MLTLTVQKINYVYGGINYSINFPGQQLSSIAIELSKLENNQISKTEFLDLVSKKLGSHMVEISF